MTKETAKRKASMASSWLKAHDREPLEGPVDDPDRRHRAGRAGHEQHESGRVIDQDPVEGPEAEADRLLPLASSGRSRGQVDRGVELIEDRVEEIVLVEST